MCYNTPMKHNLFKTLSILFLLAAVAIGAWRFYSYRQMEQRNAALEEEAMIVETPDPLGVHKEEREEERKRIRALAYPYKNIDYAALKERNEDFVAWIYVPALDLNYPVVHSHDDQDYLHLTFDREESVEGSIFLDAFVEPDFTSRNSFVFGHNMRNGSMFGSLKQFAADGGAEMVKKQPWIFIYMEDAVVRYEIFAYQFVHVDSMLYRDCEDDADYEAYLDEVMEGTLYTASEVPDYGTDRLITLSTCSGSTGTRRFIVQGIEKERYAVE